MNTSKASNAGAVQSESGKPARQRGRGRKGRAGGLVNAWHANACAGVELAPLGVGERRGGITCLFHSPSDSLALERDAVRVVLRGDASAIPGAWSGGGLSALLAGRCQQWAQRFADKQMAISGGAGLNVEPRTVEEMRAAGRGGRVVIDPDTVAELGAVLRCYLAPAAALTGQVPRKVEIMPRAALLAAGRGGIRQAVRGGDAVELQGGGMLRMLPFKAWLLWRRAMRHGLRAVRSYQWAGGHEETPSVSLFELRALADRLTHGGDEGETGAGLADRAAQADALAAEYGETWSGAVSMHAARRSGLRGLARRLRHASDCLAAHWLASGSERWRSGLRSDRALLAAAGRMARGAGLVDAGAVAALLGEGEACTGALRVAVHRLRLRIEAGDSLLSDAGEADRLAALARMARRGRGPVESAPAWMTAPGQPAGESGRAVLAWGYGRPLRAARRAGEASQAATVAALVAARAGAGAGAGAGESGADREAAAVVALVAARGMGRRAGAVEARRAALAALVEARRCPGALAAALALGPVEAARAAASRETIAAKEAGRMPAGEPLEGTESEPGAGDHYEAGRWDGWGLAADWSQGYAARTL